MSLTTSTFTRDGTAYTLPPQTTPFSYQASSGQRSDACASTSIYCPWIINQDSSPLGSQACTLGFSTSNEYGPAFNSQKDQCYPPSFFTVFRDDADADAVYPQDQDIITLAYPGSACPQNWATACTYDITAAASKNSDGKATTSRQAWCCASGYQCTTASDNFNTFTTSTKPFERQCYSYLNSQTEIWASWDPPATPNGPPTGNDPTGEYYTWPTSITWQPAKDQWTVYHKPLPLAVSSWSGELKEGGGEPAAPSATRTEVVRKKPAMAEPTKGI